MPSPEKSSYWNVEFALNAQPLSPEIISLLRNDCGTKFVIIAPIRATFRNDGWAFAAIKDRGIIRIHSLRVHLMTLQPVTQDRTDHSESPVLGG